MADAVVLDQPINAEPSQRPRRPGTFTGQTARKAGIASAQARARKAQRRMEPDVPAVIPSSADVQREPGVVVVNRAREQSSSLSEGNEVRENLSRALAAQIEVLAENPPKKVADLTGRNGLAQATKTLADAASTVFGWGDGSIPGLIMVGEVERMVQAMEPVASSGPTASQPVIEVQPVVDVTAPEQKPSLGAGPVVDQAGVVRVAGKT